jgi:DNA-binding HxlR family transcriptional regulator
MDDEMTDAATESPICEHFQRAADLIGRRWNPQILRGLQSGVTRFSDLKTGIPQISDAMLSERLKELEAEGIVTRVVTPATPVRITYGLTERGMDLSKVMDELGQWAERWADAPAATAR